MHSRRSLPIFTYGICLFLVFQARVAFAEQWVEAGDERTRHHLHVLSDAGEINLPLTSWPVMWEGVERELDNIDPASLNALEARSYQHVKRELRRSQQQFAAGQHFSLNSATPGLVDYAADSREQLESRTYVAYSSERWSGKLQASVVGDPIDDKTFRMDGSYLAGTLGNWALGVGAIERWWGPGWQNSLILSNAARPAPGLFINRVDSRAFDLPVLRWLGPWDLRVFLNELEADRSTPHAKLFGMRAAFKPWQPLEIGISRVAQWGGDGRPEGLDTFWDMLIGQDNRGGDGIDADGSNEPGNQLAGFDWRLSHNLFGFRSAFYGQMIGEDEAGGLPYKYLGLAGIETSFLWGTSHSRLALEASNTTMQFESGGTPNSAYEHPLYRSGYRHYGRPLGASTDNDSEVFVLKGFHHFAEGQSFNWTIGTGNINADGVNRAAPGGNVFANNKVDLIYATAQFTTPLTDNSELSIGGQFYDEALQLRDERIESGIYVGYEIEFGK